MVHNMDDFAPDSDELERLAEWLATGSVAVLTGAGISTASGIPDYRSPASLAQARKPIQYQEFLKSRAARARYWMRSLVGYPRLARAQPNRTHHALAALARAGSLTSLITQNVDGLHLRAGHGEHVELHGALREVVCLGCGAISSRDELQQLLALHHPELVAHAAETVADGDARFEPDPDHPFGEVTCARCGGLLKPHVVFFGENVPKPRVARALAEVTSARALLVLGSSLTVYSGFRFVRRACEEGVPVIIVNRGDTRGDDLCALKLSASVGATMAALLEVLGVPAD